MSDDNVVALMSSGVGGTFLMVLIYIYKSVVGKKSVCRCGDRDIEIGFRVDDMSPAEPKVQVRNPMRDRDLPIDVIVP